MRTPEAKQHPPAELARRLELLCFRGIAARARGWCLGRVEADDLEFDGLDLRRTVSPIRAGGRERRRGGSAGHARRDAGARDRERRRRRHLREGHDLWCEVLGVPEQALRRLAGSWDRQGAAAYLCEAIAEACAELDDRTWSETAAREAVGFAIRRRITPRAPPVDDDDDRGRGAH